MLSLINDLVLKNSALFVSIIIALLLYVIISSFYSKKGGLPRMGNVILSKNKFLLLIIVLFLITLAVGISLPLIFSKLLFKYVDYVLPILFILLGSSLLSLHKEMRWNFDKHGWFLIILGGILFFLEIFLY